MFFGVVVAVAVVAIAVVVDLTVVLRWAMCSLYSLLLSCLWGVCMCGAFVVCRMMLPLLVWRHVCCRAFMCVDGCRCVCLCVCVCASLRVAIAAVLCGRPVAQSERGCTRVFVMFLVVGKQLTANVL